MIDPESSRALSRASALFHAGRTTEAASAYEELLRRCPALPDSWFNLATAYRRLGRPDAALAAYDRALAFDVRSTEEVLLRQAIIQSEDLDRPDRARALLRQAIEMAPDYFDAWLNLGNLEEDCGDVEAAGAAYQRARTIRPGDALALARSLGVASQPGPLIDEARTRLKAGALSAREEADIAFALASALDAAGDYDAAWRAYTTANAAARRDGATARYDRASVERYVNACIAQPGGIEARRPDPLTAQDRPIFICGMFRSGSTLVENLLARHPETMAGGELNLLPRASAMLQHDPARIATAAPAQIETLRAAYCDAVRTSVGRDRRLLDKQPENILHMGLALRMFPAGTVVNTVREPVDNCLSVFFLNAGPGLAYATDLSDIAHYWRQQERLARHWQDRFGPAMHRISYDALVSRPAETLAALVQACGLDTRVDLLARPPVERAIRTASMAQVRKPLYRSSSGRWRNYARHLAPLIDDMRNFPA